MYLTHVDQCGFHELPGRRSADPLAGIDVGSLSVRLARLTSGPRAPHLHPSCAEVIYVMEGHGTAWLDGERTRVGAGDIFVFPAGRPHATLPDPGTEMLLLCTFPVDDLAGNTVEFDEAIELPRMPE
ncbi:MAG: cupin domain-containing protein [Solirubrobacteraceae bacterium]